MSKSIYITGVAGFLGSNLARLHLDRGDRVFGCDNFATSLQNSKHLRQLKSDGLRFAVMDVCSEEFVKTLICGKIDVIYNMACPASPPAYQAMPVLTLLTSVMGVRNVLVAARFLNARVVHASTSEVYGDPITSPQCETDPGRLHTWGPRSCYDSGKAAAEALCHDNPDVDVRVARIFNTYGPNMRLDDGRVVTNLVNQALRNKDLTIYGGVQTRSFCYVDDLIAGLVRLGEISENPRAPVNIGNPTEFTMLELAREVLAAVPESTSGITYCSTPVHDPQQRRPDITRAQRVLDWQPKISLAEGLRRFVRYAREIVQGETP